MLRDVATAARQWQVSRHRARPGRLRRWPASTWPTPSTRRPRDEEAVLLPLLGEHLSAGDWAVIARSSHCRLSAREQLFVLGLALEDSCAADRARLLDGLSPAARLAWRLHGRQDYRAAVVRLRGAPPAA